jgi:glycosyltransferase involved in cell wall biosynthesis
MYKTISVIIPTLNEEKFIGKCLSAVKKQDYCRDFETIVVDGHSTDRTKEVASKYNVKTLDSPKRNIGFQKNFGTHVCNGEICFYLDADSIAPENWITRHLKEYENDRRTVMVGSPVSFDLAFYSAVHQPGELVRKVFSKLSVPLLTGSGTSILKDVFYDFEFEIDKKIKLKKLEKEIISSIKNH